MKRDQFTKHFKNWIEECDCKPSIILFTHGNVDWAANLMWEYGSIEEIHKFFKKIFCFEFEISEGYRNILLDFQCIVSFLKSKEEYVPKKKFFFIPKSDLERLIITVNGDEKLAKKLLKTYNSCDNVYEMIKNKTMVMSDNGIPQIIDVISDSEEFSAIKKYIDNKYYFDNRIKWGF